MGIVYLARQVRLNRLCALKMVLAGPHAHPEALVRFLAEAEAGARLQHERIVQIHNVGEHDGLPFLELEYLAGGSLDRILDGTPWPPKEAAAMVEVLARAVSEAHAIGIVHRDLKPSNVLLTPEGLPKVGDFGLAKALQLDGCMTATDSVLGSPHYMAPEQADGRTREVGPPADVYALGAILYELLTGRPPFVAPTVLETLEQVKTVEPAPLSRLQPSLPRDLETICLKCLCKEPARRYPTGVELADDLGRFLRGEPIRARRIRRAERTWRWCKRHPDLAALIAAVVLLSMTLAVVATAAAAAFRSIADHERRLLASVHAVRGADAAGAGRPARRPAEPGRGPGPDRRRPGPRRGPPGPDRRGPGRGPAAGPGLAARGRAGRRRLQPRRPPPA